MSFETDYGDGRLKDCTVADGLCKNLNSYAKVTSINQNIIEIDIDNAFIGEFAKFDAGENILIHTGASNRATGEYLGQFQIYRIELVDGNRLTLNKEIFNCDLNYEYVQAVTIPQFKNLILKNATLTPRPYDVFKFYGGILVAQVYEDFILENSQIDLTDGGIPFQKKMTYRPLSEQEMYGETDGAKFAGLENLTPLVLNSGDGAVFIQARNFICDENSRIGNPKTHGRAKCRGAADSIYKPSNITNIGGSSIFIACENIQIRPENLAKYRNADLPGGRGLARCEIVSETLLPNDEKLYHFDIPAKFERVQNLGIENFGDGNLGAAVNPTYQLNNYAKVESILGNRVYYSNKTLGGVATFDAGNLVILRDTSTGKFVMARVLEYDEDFLILDKIIDATEIISVPEFESLAITTPLNIAGAGVICCSDTFTLTSEITAADLSGAGNAQSWNKLTGLLIIAKNIVFGENGRLRAGTTLICETLENFSDDVFCCDNNFVYKL